MAPDTLGADTLEPLRELVKTYPYCGTFAHLYLYNLSRIQDLRYTSELRRLSLLLPDRQMLYEQVESHAVPSHTKGKELEHNEEDAFALIDSFLSQARAQGEDLPQELNFGESVDRDDYFSSERISSLDRREDVAKNIPPLSSPTERESAPVTHTYQSDTELEERLFTETLAKIYIQQGHYDKALRIIRSISLNYPKKNRYFAQQIRFLERLIQNK